MSSAPSSSILLLALAGFVLLGRTGRQRLPEHHLSADSRDALKLALGLVATMTALLLGLPISRRRRFPHLELDHPLGGLIRISSEPMVQALNYVGK